MNSSPRFAFRRRRPDALIDLSGVMDYLLWYAQETRTAKISTIFHPKATWRRRGRHAIRSRADSYVADDNGLSDLSVSAQCELSTVTNHKSVHRCKARRRRLVSAERGPTFRPAITGWNTNLTAWPDCKSRAAVATGHSIRYVRYLDDFTVVPLTMSWADTMMAGFAIRQESMWFRQPRLGYPTLHPDGN